MKSPTLESRGSVKPWLLGGAIAVVLAATLFSYRFVAPDVSLDLSAAGRAPGGRRLVVLPVANATGQSEHDWVRLGLTELVAETLRRTDGIAVVAPERLASVLEARGLDPADAEVRRRVRELGIALGADLVLDVEARRSSRGVSSGERYSLRFEVQDGGGEVLGGGELKGADPAEIAERLSDLVAGALSGRTQPVALDRVFSASPFLNRLYGMGVSELRRAGPEAALPYFEIAVSVQPGFLAARYRIAECRRLGGRLEESRSLLLALVEESQNRGERVWEARSLAALAVVAALAGDTAKAAELDGQVLSLAAIRNDATAQLAVLRDLARFALADGDDARAGELFAEIGRRQEEMGDRLGRVDTLVQTGALALRAGDMEAAVAAFNEGRSLASEVGDVRAEMQLLASLGEVSSRRGRHAEAVELWLRAATFYEQRGESARELPLRRDIAEALLQESDLDGAEDAFQDLRELAVKAGDESLEALASLRLTWILLRRGYPYQARPHLDRAIELDRRLNQPLALQRMIAWMAYEEGNYKLAHSTLAAVQRQAGDGWTQLDAEFLEVFARALERGERLPVPGEAKGELR